MTATDRDGDWSQLRFEEAVLTEFRFLETDYGYQRTSAGPSEVVYGRDDLLVAVNLDRVSFQLDAVLSVGKAHARERFSVWEIARLAGASDVNERTFLQASTAERVAQLVPLLAGVLQKYGGDALRGDRGTLLQLREQQQRESDEFLLAGRLAQIRQEVVEAWRSRDYAHVARLLESIEPHLTPAELQKLDYARRH